MAVDKIGQLFISGIQGLTLEASEKEFIENEDLGGIILFAHNYDSPAQLADLVNSIQVLRNDYPLFISVDHEGGRVQRFKSNFTHFPPMLNFSQTQSPKLCYEIHKIMAEELSVCGVNVNFSPVCDLLTNPNNKVIGDRAFHQDHEEASKFISAAIRGLQTNGVLACAKHFPGHGNTSKDSHFDLPVVKTDLETLRNREFIPFIKAAKARVEFIMVAHLVVDAIDETKPCTLSEKCYQMIRDELKFNKLIITDDMEMKAITDHFELEQAAIMALNAGSDILLYRSMAAAKIALKAVKEAIKFKKIAKDMIEEKLQRVLSTKKEFFQEYNPIYIPGIVNKINTPATQKILGDIKKKLQLT